MSGISASSTDSVLPISAESSKEFHAARILLLLRFAGQGGKRIESLTKLAKLDFFVRYPKYFGAATSDVFLSTSQTESPMIRFHYGPWDKRYYDLLAFLKSRNLVRLARSGRGIAIELTTDGEYAAEALAARSPYVPLVATIFRVKSKFGAWSGTKLKNFIYEQFDKEVTNVRRGVEIK
jgi:hypothetical protein